MAELHLIGEISGASGFGDNSLFCRYSIQGGPNWRVISGNTEGQTLADSPLYEGPAIWSHPIDVHFSSKGIQGWPKIQLQVYCLDYIGRYWIKGYAVVSVPCSPGLHTIETPCWAPASTSIYERVSQYFLGGGNQLLSPDVLYTGKDRYKLKTHSEGLVKLRLEVILKDFIKYGVEYK
ncbi:B9 domain-containing protein 2 [Arctopsyche grandis]|uniref:B9 domain-containing protein 2 n=1 Tax=Arctopsyche grandis TaxID=121162 RepID=UPI00406D8665